MSLTIRPYTAADWPAIQAIHDAARPIELQHARLDDAFVPLQIAAKREGLFDDTLLVAEDARHVVGFVAFTTEELSWLYVDPRQFNAGIGGQLVTAALEAAPTIQDVEVLAGNRPARHLYEKYGFQFRQTESGHMPGNEQFAVTVDQLTRVPATAD